MTVWNPACPRCGSRRAEGHRAKCSLRRELDEQEQADEVWFRRRPGREERVRFTTTAEQLSELFWNGGLLGRVARLERIAGVYNPKTGTYSIDWLRGHFD